MLAACIWLSRHRHRNSSKRNRTILAAIIGFLCLMAGLSLTAGSFLFWYQHRSLPSNTQQTLFEGVTYFREVRRQPRPMIIHIVNIDLDAPGIGFFVTPARPADGHKLTAQTTSQFLAEFGLQIAINGDFFEPWWSNSIFDYYPHIGDPVDVFGFASSKGTIYSTGRPNWPTLYISVNNTAHLRTPIGDIYNAVSGNLVFLEHGKLTIQPLDNPYLADPQPRTAVGLSSDAQHLMLVVVDGRQPNYSEGATIRDLVDIMLKYGADMALNLDGGGSSTLVMQNEAGQPVLLNSPIDNRIPGRERAVGNHLGVYARRLRAGNNG